VIEDTLRQAESKMHKAIEVAKEEFSGIRTGRANPALVNRLQVGYYGTPTPLQQLAGISAPEARLLVVSPYDRNATSSIEKAIRNSDLGINPANDGQVIRLAFPSSGAAQGYVKLANGRPRTRTASGVRRHGGDWSAWSATARSPGRAPGRAASRASVECVAESSTLLQHGAGAARVRASLASPPQDAGRGRIPVVSQAPGPGGSLPWPSSPGCCWPGC
jgi:ribosome recycling factor